MDVFSRLAKEFQDAARAVVDDAVDIGLACRGERRISTEGKEPLPFVVTEEFITFVGTRVQQEMYGDAIVRRIPLPDLGKSVDLSSNLDGIVVTCLRDNKKIKPIFCKGS